MWRTDSDNCNGNSWGNLTITIDSFSHLKRIILRLVSNPEKGFRHNNIVHLTKRL